MRKKKILFSILSVLLIIILMPRGIIVEMLVTKGGVWEEPTLVAPFDIPLLKSSSNLEEDKKILEASFEPIYILDTSEIAALNDSLSRELYIKGIISDNDVENITSGSIRIISQENTFQRKAISDITKVSEAEKLLKENGISKKIIPSLILDEKLSFTDKLALYKRLSNTDGLISEGEVIVTKGQIIDELTQLRIDSYIQEYKLRMGTDIWWLLIAIGRFIIVSLALILNIAFLETPSNRVNGEELDFKKFAFIMGAYALILALIAILNRTGFTEPYIIPITIIPILFLVLFNTRTAIVGNITISILAALFTQIPFEYFTVNILAGISAILILQNFYHRKVLFKAIAVIFIIQVITSESFQLIEGYSIISTDSLERVSIFILSNVILLGFYQLIYVIEKIFGFVSNITLLENSDTNQPLLLKLAHLAPGTFQHCVQVANLAEAAAKLVDANPLLARCGALYHDIGKMNNPMYFIENTRGDNPHDNCSPYESARIIKSHVSDGLEIAKKNGLPDCITRFIATHHGNSVISYFYNKAMNENGDNVDKSAFCYPGENPKSKEECICMICDSIEAAARSMSSYNEQSINGLVEKLIDNIINQGHMTESRLTFEETNKIKEMLKEQLKNIYHVRIAYPE